MPNLSFTKDIATLFRTYDIDEMKAYGMDLSSYFSVKEHAQDIYGRLMAKDMPCDQPWSDENITKFKEWVDGGMQP